MGPYQSIDFTFIEILLDLDFRPLLLTGPAKSKPLASLLSGKVRNAERGAVAGELGCQLCTDREWCQKGRVGEAEQARAS